jgi:hypothetical protein
MRRSLVKFSGPEASNHTPSLADFITTTSGFELSVHTGIVLGAQAARLATVDQVTSRGFEVGYLGVLE